MSALGLLHPPRIIGSLHDLGCRGPSDCSCSPVYVVSGDRTRETPETEQPFDYTADSRVELQSDRLRREASPVLNPLVAPRSVIEVEQ